MVAELSCPQFWQTNWTGVRAISGVTSNAYLVPQAHWIFMRCLVLEIQQDSPGFLANKKGTALPTLSQAVFTSIV